MAYPNHTAWKIWPTGPDYESTPAHGPFSIHFIAEGFVDTQADKDEFEEKCNQFLDGLIGNKVRPSSIYKGLSRFLLTRSLRNSTRWLEFYCRSQKFK